MSSIVYLWSVGRNFALCMLYMLCVDVFVLCLLLNSGDATVGKSAITQVFHSDNSQFPKNYTMVY